MKEAEKQKQPTYEELLEFYQRHQGRLEEWSFCLYKRITAQEERMANLTSTWTGRLTLLAENLRVTCFDVLLIAFLVSVNFWVLVFALIEFSS